MPAGQSAGKARARASSFLSMRSPPSMSDTASQSSGSTTYHELPASHFLAQPPNLASSSTWAGRKEAELWSEKSFSSAKGSQQSPLSETRSTGSVSTEEQDHLSHIPAHLLGDLALAPQRSTRADGPSARAYMPDTSTLASADFDVDVRSGFLPPEAPVSRLEGIEEEVWESALDQAQRLPLRIAGGPSDCPEEERRRARQWRRQMRAMLVLHPSPQVTSDIRFARRAHQVLSLLAHYYIHSQPTANSTTASSSWLPRFRLTLDDIDRREEEQGKYASTVPAAIAVPWVAISRLLDLPPVMTYADSVLWNWRLKNPSRGLAEDNFEMTSTFTGTASEAHFYKTSLIIEKRGVAALALMRQSLDEAFVGDKLAKKRIGAYLRRLARVVQSLTKALYDVRTNCDPAIFYWGIRPWLNGGDSGVDAKTGEKGWLFEGVEEFQGKRMVFTGPSAGQSTLIHSLDVFLGVDHAKKTRRDQNASEKENATFMEKMQLYMPGHHRNFLTHLKGISFAEDREDDSDEESDDEMVQQEKAAKRHPLRSLLIETDDESELLREAYNEVLTSLKHLRDEHMRVASLYIISQMRLTPPAQYARLDAKLVTRSNDPAEEGGAKGTGGTDLVSFLRDCRKNTLAALYR